ncbi:flavodoxin [Carboxylicivirga marina]|uniref:Flavodoxin n=1 Tax=Carboxylicivirga marina TaxID=2800988 RepID=A0ABS1HLC3_9BACT|nr:flavodoxin [Carboxylicivirga marina]MBK3518347.1 flavodoxin [Carboxylicivirga marina]
MQTAILFGSSLGNTQFVAEKIHKHIPNATCLPVNDLSVAQITSFDNLVLGTSTWGVGNLQDDFELFVDLLLTLDMSKTTFALFGLGDQYTYPDTFCNGMGKLYHLLNDKGWRIVGSTSVDGYDFSESEAQIDEQFVGLALDEDNEPDLSDIRIEKWVKNLPF